MQQTSWRIAKWNLHAPGAGWQFRSKNFARQSVDELAADWQFQVEREPAGALACVVGQQQQCAITKAQPAQTPRLINLETNAQGYSLANDVFDRRDRAHDLVIGD